MYTTYTYCTSGVECPSFKKIREFMALCSYVIARLFLWKSILFWVIDYYNAFQKSTFLSLPSNPIGSPIPVSLETDRQQKTPPGISIEIRPRLLFLFFFFFFSRTSISPLFHKHSRITKFE